jgi:phosphoribosylformimino-5-aminoimidazole carboxamide ribonucleotide (ProFAR) isomerase
VNIDAAQAFADAIPIDRLSPPSTAAPAAWRYTAGRQRSTFPRRWPRARSSRTRTFLYTHVDTEGLLGGINMDAVRSVAASTSRKLIAAGGIRSHHEIDLLDAEGIDAVVGMAIYKQVLA